MFNLRCTHLTNIIQYIVVNYSILECANSSISLTWLKLFLCWITFANLLLSLSSITYLCSITYLYESGYFSYHRNITFNFVSSALIIVTNIYLDIVLIVVFILGLFYNFAPCTHLSGKTTTNINRSWKSFWKWYLEFINGFLIVS